MNMWKRVEGETCCCHKKLKEMEINKEQQNNNNIPYSLINEFFGNDWFYNKIDPTQHNFFEDLVLYITLMAEAHGFKDSVYVLCFHLNIS
jgi:hypothetical protein